MKILRKAIRITLVHLCFSFNSWHPLNRAKIYKSSLDLIMYAQIIQILARNLKALSAIMNTQSWNNKLEITHIYGIKSS